MSELYIFALAILVAAGARAQDDDVRLDPGDDASRAIDLDEAPPPPPAAEPTATTSTDEPPPPTTTDAPGTTDAPATTDAAPPKATTTPAPDRAQGVGALLDTARPWHVRARAFVTSWLNVDPSLAVLKESNEVVVPGVAIEGEWLPMPELSVTASVAYGLAAFTAPVLGLSTRTQLHEFDLGVGAGWRFFDLVTPYVRVGGSGTLLEATLSGGTDVHGGWSPFTLGAHGYAGVEATVPRDRVPLRLGTAGAFIEGGYHWLGDFTFGAAAPPDEDLIERRRADLGTLSLGGPALRCGLLLSF